MNDFERLIGALAAAKVRYIIVGGVAAILHGATRLTQDLDILYARDDENLESLVRAIAPMRPRLRGAPPGLPFLFDAATLKRGLNVTLETTAGSLDLLGEMAGGGTFARLAGETVEAELFGHRVLCLSRRALIDAKRAAGRAKDFEVIAELEVIDEELG